MNRIDKFRNVAVSLEVSDRKRNPHMSEKMSFLAPKRNSFSVGSDNFNWKDLLFSIADGEEHLFAESHLGSMQALPPVAARAEPTYPTHKTSNICLTKNDSNIFQLLV